MTWMLRGLAVLVIAAGIAGAALSFVLPKAPTALSPDVAEIEAVELAPLPLTPASARSALLDRSPFDPARKPFNRTPPPDPMANVEVRLLGLSTRGGRQRATLQIGGQTLQVYQGDETPIGPVDAIDGKSVTIGGASGRTLGMFQ
jgi:glycine/D-amino acid oxidase-like deaminating enzyme